MRWILAILFAAFSCQGAVYTKPTSANGLALNAPKWLVKGVALSPSAVVVASGGSGTTLLLDESGLGSAAVAYSVRKLRSAYAGSALRVRRSSDSTEQDIGFSGNDLDTASLASFCSGTDGFVVRWYDQSGNARNATQATASKQPKIVSSGSVLAGANGKPAMQFDGSDDILIVAWSHSQPTTDSVVIKISTYTSIKYITASYNQDNYIWANRGASPQMQQYAGAWVSSNSTGSIGSWQLCTVGFNGASSFIQVNANSDTTGNAGAATSAGLDIMGTQVYQTTIHGELSELVRWNSAIGSPYRTTQRSNINAYFSLY